MLNNSISVAPMLDWTDRHCRYFHRLITKKARLYTEMVTTGAIIHGDVARHLDFSEEEHPIALQLGGSDPNDLALCAKRAKQWGYDEINLNCGCPSPRVQKGAFGACLMNETDLVVRCVQAICDASHLKVSVKHRIGVDNQQDYDFVYRFIERVSQTGCKTFIVHARRAILAGLSPKENRDVPPLRYEIVYQLKKDFPKLEIILNGGVTTLKQATNHMQYVDGVMIGRAAYHQPKLLHGVDELFYGEPKNTVTIKEIVMQMAIYCDRMLRLYGEKGLRLQGITRHMLGLAHGQKGARQFRQMLSDATLLAKNDPKILLKALEVLA